MNRIVVLAALAGGAAAATAQQADVGPSRIAGYIYIKVATGERTIIRNAPRGAGLLWANNDNAGDGNAFHALSGPLRTDGRQQYTSAGLDWGDIEDGARIDAFSVGFATSAGTDILHGQGQPIRATAADPNVDPTVYGLDMVIAWVDNESGRNDADHQFVQGFLIQDLPGEDDLGNAWVLTVDLAGSGNEFILTGTDEDGDQRHDFGYYYQFFQNQNTDPRNPIPINRGNVGPLLVLGYEGGGIGMPPAYGSEDAIDWYNGADANTGLPIDFHSTRFFGGAPWADYWMELYGAIGNPCHADFNGDGFLDFFDFTDFVDCFEGVVCPPGQTADYNGDGFPDFFDFQDFVTDFEQGC